MDLEARLNMSLDDLSANSKNSGGRKKGGGAARTQRSGGALSRWRQRTISSDSSAFSPAMPADQRPRYRPLACASACFRTQSA